MSSARDKAQPQGQGKARAEAKGRRIRPAASIARSVTWGFWWRRLFMWAVLDLLVVSALILAFIWHCDQLVPASALDGITSPHGSLTRILPAYWGFSGEGLDVGTWLLHVYGGDGNTYDFAASPFLQAVSPVLVGLAVCQTLDLLHFISDTRRVRRTLAPLNDLALMAETLSQAGVADPMARAAADDDKMATLEQAIARASVDSPTVSTGDSDLRPIEVALNGLLRQMQEAKLQQMRFVSDASHELRTPIAVIQGYVNLLDRWGSSDEEVMRESIEALKAESEHMQELVEQLLFLARGDSGRNTLQRQPVNLAGVVREVWDESAMIDAGHAYRCPLTEADEADASYEVTGDLAMLKQALRIVVQNAEKYSPTGSAITLAAHADADQVSCTVTDEGIGMSEAEAAHAFERFWRADAARAEGAEGSGLGLSIAKWIVDAHGGSIGVLSREGVGTRITISVPR